MNTYLLACSHKQDVVKDKTRGRILVKQEVFEGGMTCRQHKKLDAAGLGSASLGIKMMGVRSARARKRAESGFSLFNTDWHTTQTWKIFLPGIPGNSHSRLNPEDMRRGLYATVT